MSKTIIAILFFVSPAFAAKDPKPEYTKKVLGAFQQKIKAQTAKKELWSSYQEMLKDLGSSKIVINNESQLIYMNSLMLALNEITEKEFKAGKCAEMSHRMDSKFLTQGVSFKNSPQHYQDAKQILQVMCK